MYISLDIGHELFWYHALSRTFALVIPVIPVEAPHTSSYSSASRSRLQPHELICIVHHRNDSHRHTPWSTAQFIKTRDIPHLERPLAIHRRPSSPHVGSLTSPSHHPSSMDRGLESSLWAPLPSGRKHHVERHDNRSRSLPPPISALAASAASAPATAATTTATTTTSKPAAPARLQSFHRFEQTCQRLRWKFIDLENSYARALAPSDWRFGTADAERNFKVDFYEFYAWIEQAIVFLLLVFGVVVRRGGPGVGSGSGSSGTHAYHHNVLKALDEEGNPLHGTLGTGDVNHALWKAKELRNRWKDAAEGRETPPLKMYDLRWIVTQVLGGLEGAYVLAGREVEGDLAREEEQELAGEDGWEWMVESMDWEA